MPYTSIRTRYKGAVRAAIAALSLPSAVADSIVARRHPLAAGLTAPAIVISLGKATRKASPAGLRIRELVAIASIYFKLDGTTEMPNDLQEEWLERIEAAFDIPPTMPAAITSGVPECCELRVQPADSYLPAQYRYSVDAHRLAILAEVCQTAGAPS